MNFPKPQRNRSIRGRTERFHSTLKGKVRTMAESVINYKSLLALAHEKGLDSILTEPLEVREDFAFFRATVTMTGGKVFMGHAEATPANVKPAMRTCLPRLAETRAKARALRDAVNIGEVSAEELPDFSDRPARQQQRAAAAGPRPLNDSGQTCPHRVCNAPPGKPHGTSCPITLEPAPAGV